MLQHKRKHDSMHLVNVNIDTEEGCSQIVTKTDSNHEKSEVKVVFIRNGFHTTLLHKTRKTVRPFGIEFQYMAHVKTEKGNIIQNNSSVQMSKCVQ